MSGLTTIDLAQTFSAAHSQRFEIGAANTVEIKPEFAQAANELFQEVEPVDYTTGVNTDTTFKIDTPSGMA